MSEPTTPSQGKTHGSYASQSAPLTSSMTSANERTPLLNGNARPPLLRAMTTTAAITKPTVTRASATPSLSRPLATRSVTSTTDIQQASLVQTPTTPQLNKPSLVRSATDTMLSSLELVSKTSRSNRNAPPAPVHWTDHAHRNALLSIWDATANSAATSKYPNSIISRLVSTEKHMMQEYPELAEGGMPLTREWIEYVLGLNLRHPFCTAAKMGRWEVLSAAGGARGNWGPW